MTGKSVVAALAIAAAVIAVPLVLKSRVGSNAEPPVRHEPSNPRTSGSEQARPPKQRSTTAAARPGQALPRFVDLGTTTCAPCRVMLGVMQELERQYPDSMIVEFVNVHENQVEAQRYGIQIIPTQIFLAPDGRELYRHTGVLRAQEVIAKWAELGFHFGPPAEG